MSVNVSCAHFLFLCVLGTDTNDMYAISRLTQASSLSAIHKSWRRLPCKAAAVRVTAVVDDQPSGSGYSQRFGLTVE